MPKNVPKPRIGLNLEAKHKPIKTNVSMPNLTCLNHKKFKETRKEDKNSSLNNQTFRINNAFSLL